MKTLKKIILTLTASSLLTFASCMHDDSVNYQRLEELNKIYIDMWDAKANIWSLSKDHAGDEEEAYNMIYNKLAKDADSIKKLLPKKFKEKADSLYDEVF